MYVTLNISATSIKLLSIERGKIDKWEKAPLAPGLVRDGLILQPKAVGSAIDALFNQTKVPRENVITSLTGLTFTHRILSLPPMKPALLEEAIQRAARKEMPLPPEELYLTWQVIGKGQDELNFLVLGVPRNLIDTAVETLAIAGVKPYLMDLKPLALARAANRAEAIIVDLEPDSFDIVLVANGFPAIMHTVASRGEGASLEDNIQRLTDELSKTVKFYKSSHPESPLSPTTPLLLTGELSSDAAASQLIQAEIEYPVEPLIPPLKLPPDLPIALYASNIGLALKTTPKSEATRSRDVNLNILSGKYQARAQPAPLRKILAALAFIIAIGLLFPLYQVKSQADARTMHLQTRLGTVSHQLQEIRLAIDKAKQIEATIGEIVANADTIQEEHQYILSKRGDFTSNLNSVANALPPGAHFTHIETATRQITVGGEADNAFTVISYVMALEAVGEFSEVRIAEIAGNKSTGVSFSIVITKPD